MEYTSLLTASLDSLAWGDKVKRVLSAALQAVDPFKAVTIYLKRYGDTLIFADQSYNLASFDEIYVIGAGKAGLPMSEAIASVLGDRLHTGIVIVKEGYQDQSAQQPLAGIEILQAGHPIPDERGVHASRRIARLLQKAKFNDLIICLISGGGSALLTDPAPSISLDDLQSLTALLLASGANINEINTLRKHLDRIKGGNLARLATPATVLTLILSDVVGNQLDIIASGPTVADPST
jgi:glycerate 2-kinase